MGRSVAPFGVLAIQGDFEAHQRALARVGARGVAVRGERDAWFALQREFLAGADASRAERALRQRGVPLDGVARPAGAGRAGPARLIPLLGEGERVRLAVLHERWLARGSGPVDEPLVGLDELLSVTAVHEQGHLCDRARYLPIARHLPRIALLLLRTGFSPRAVARRLEYRAQLTCLCSADDPRLPLADTLRLSEARDQAVTPHASAYAQLTRDLLRAFAQLCAERPEAWPEVDPDFHLAHQLHFLGPEQVRAIALEAARAEGLVAQH